MTSISEQFYTNVSQLTAQGAPWEINETGLKNQVYRCYTHAPKTLADLINEGRKHGENEFLVYEDERLTFNDFFRQADNLAGILKNTYGLKPDDSVAIAMRNYPEWMIAFAAIAFTGATIVPVNSWGQQAELLYVLKDAGVKLAFFDQQRFDLVSGDLANLDIQGIVAKPDKATPYMIDMATLTGNEAHRLKEAVQVEPESRALIMYTSGTTGSPKGAVSSHRNICQSIFNFEMLAIAAAMTDGELIGKMLERGFPPKVLLAVPLFHVAGCYSVFLLSLRGGRPIVIMRKWDTQKALATIEQERITMISAAPSMLLNLLEHPAFDNFDTASMFGFGAGGSAQPPRLAKLVYEKLPDSFPGTGYGMTESNATGFAASGSVFAHHPDSAGIKSPIVDIKIIDDDGQEVNPCERGEIFLRSPTIAQGYHNRPEASAETFVDGWLKTGDVGYVNDEGYLFVTDRIKDLVIRGGENIYSIEVENTAINHPDILEAAVIGIPHDDLGEEVGLVVHTKEKSALTQTQIQAFIGETLAKYKVPAFVFFEASPLPKNATQKVLKKVLKERHL